MYTGVQKIFSWALLPVRNYKYVYQNALVCFVGCMCIYWYNKNEIPFLLLFSVTKCFGWIPNINGLLCVCYYVWLIICIQPCHWIQWKIKIPVLSSCEFWALLTCPFAKLIKSDLYLCVLLTTRVTQNETKESGHPTQVTCLLNLYWTTPEVWSTGLLSWISVQRSFFP